MADNLDKVREIGNFAAHPKRHSAGCIIDVEPEEAEWLIELVEYLFDFAFIQPAKDTKRSAKLNEKLEKKVNKK